MDKRPIRLGYSVVAGVVACSLTLSQAPSAWAQAKPGSAAAELAAAKKYYAEGEKHYKAGDYTTALDDFKKANDIKSTPHAERYIGLCEDNLGNYQAATNWYDRFLTHVPDKLASQGDEIRKRDGEIKAMHGKVHVDSNPPAASVSVDDKPATSSTPTDLDLPPGSHTLKLTAPGHLPAVKSVDVAFASTQTVTADLDPEPAAPPPPSPVAAAAAPPPASLPSTPPPPPEPRSIVPAVVTGGLAVAAAAVGTVFGVLALNDKSKFDKNPTTATADSGDTHALISDMSFGVAITFGVTSAVLLLTKDEAPAATSANQSHSEKKTAVTFTPTPLVAPHGGGGGFVLRF